MLNSRKSYVECVRNISQTFVFHIFNTYVLKQTLGACSRNSKLGWKKENIFVNGSLIGAKQFLWLYLVTSLKGGVFKTEKRDQVQVLSKDHNEWHIHKKPVPSMYAVHDLAWDGRQYQPRDFASRLRSSKYLLCNSKHSRLDHHIMYTAAEEMTAHFINMRFIL